MDIETKKIIYAIYYPLVLLAVIWMIWLVGYISGSDFSIYGNYPLSLSHWYGIFLQPLIHGDLMHIWSNSVPLAFLVWALFYFYGDLSFRIFTMIWIFTGLLTWLIGRPANHIGASGIVYGLAFFIFFSGLFRRTRSLMALSGIVALTYGGFVWDMLPLAELWRPELSWEGHLSGAVTGSTLAFLFRSGPPFAQSIDDEISEEEITDQYWSQNPEQEDEHSDADAK